MNSVLMKFEEFSKNHEDDAEAGLALMSALRGECHHYYGDGYECELCGRSEFDEGFDGVAKNIMSIRYF